MLIGYDGSAAARRAVRFLSRLAVPAEAELLLTGVEEPFAVPTGTPVGYRRRAIDEAHKLNERLQAAARKSLEDAAGDLRQGGRRVAMQILAGAAAPELDAAARRAAADLIVVGSRKPSPLRHYLLGSTAEKLVRHAHTSVLVVR